MERKTIFRSSLCAALLLALGAGWSGASAQEERPATHTVTRGDTLWDLAARYLGDPFLWPQIYRINTDVVEDPHWIYPGEVLRLSGEDAPPAVPAEDTPAPLQEGLAPPAEPEAGAETGSGGMYPIPDFAQRRPQEFADMLRAYVDRTYRPLRPGEFYSSGFLTEGRQLPFGRMLGDVTPQQIRNLREGTVPLLYTQVGVRAPEGATYAPGDSLLVVQLGSEYRGYGTAVVPTAMVRVTGRAEKQYLGEVVAIYGPVRNGQLVLPAERFSPGGEERAVPVTEGVEGVVIGAREVRELKHPQNVVFIDLGREDGVGVGDIFEIRREPGPRPGAADNIEETMASGQVVRVGDRSATLLLLNIVSPDIRPGTPVRQIGRLPRGADH